MWSTAIVIVGISSAEFWAMTPRMFDALLKRKERENQERDFLFAQLASVYVNYSMAAPKNPVPPAEFMPSEIRKKLARKRNGPSREEREAVDRQTRAFFEELTKRLGKGGSG